MSKKYQILLLAALLVLSGLWATVVAQEAETPGDAVEEFYNWYLDYVGYDTETDTFRNPLVERAYRDSEYLTQAFIERVDERLANAGDTGIGYDLFLCAQDEPQRFEYRVLDVMGDEAGVLLREFFGGPRSHNLMLTLRNEADGWKIDDVVCGETVTPRGVVETFYNRYLEQWHLARNPSEEGAAPGGNPLMEGAYREQGLLSRDLIAQVDEALANREMGGGDPFLCAQDIPQSIWVHEVVTEESTATVLLQAFFQGNPTPHNLTVTLESGGEQWLIAQITCGVAPETMARLLYKEYGEQVRYNLDNNIEMDVLRNPVPHWNRNVSAELLERLVAETEGERMADPVLCAQDIPERFTAEVVESSDTAATVRMSGEFPSGPDTYQAFPLATVTMEMIEGQWTLTDIACAQ